MYTYILNNKYFFSNKYFSDRYAMERGGKIALSAFFLLPPLRTQTKTFKHGYEKQVNRTYT